MSSASSSSALAMYQYPLVLPFFIYIITRNQILQHSNFHKGQIKQQSGQMDVERFRLTSIIQEEIEQDVEPKTQISLLKVYHQLYAGNYIPVPTHNPLSHFSQISQKINAAHFSPLSQFQPFHEEDSLQKAESQLKTLFGKQVEQLSAPTFLSKQELADRLKRSKKKPIEEVTVSPVKKEKELQMDKLEKATTETKASVSDILSQLKDFDDQRSDIKYLVYTEDPESFDFLYERWGELHSKMKETLELYIETIGGGRSLPEIFLQAELHKGKTIEGLSAETLYTKLDMFLQSLYLDQRELLLYQANNEKDRSIKSQPERARKKLIYE